MLPAILFILMDATVAPPPIPPPPAAITAPASIGKPHVCDENQYPISALQNGTEGATVVAFKITPQGGVTDVSVLTSSGNVDIDNASVICARDWQYLPAVQNGAPVEVSWRARVKWQIDVTESDMEIDRATYRCIMSDETSRDEIRESNLHTVVRVHFSNGAVSSAIIVASSGFPDLDRKVGSCYAQLPPELTAAFSGEMDQLFVAMLAPGT
jgi:TonB family protein